MQLQLPHLRKRQQQDEKIGEDSRGRVGDPGCDLVDASARDVGIPELLDRYADKDEEEGDTNDPSENKGDDEPRHLLEEWDVEDAVVHQHQTELGPAQIPGVENLCHDEVLGHQHDVVDADLVCVESHAHRVHREDEANNNEVP